MVNDLERTTDKKMEEHRTFGLQISILRENMRVLLKHLKCCITEQGLDSLAPEGGKSESSAHCKVSLPKNQNYLEMEWAVSTGSELPVTGCVQETVQPGL